MPAATSAIPPKTSNRRALMGAKAAVMLAGMGATTVVTVSAQDGRGASVKFVLRVPEPLVGSRGLLAPKGRNHVFREHLLGLDAFPVLEAAEVRHNS